MESELIGPIRQARFINELKVQLVDGAGRGRWRLLRPLVFESVRLDALIVVPSDYVTDFASVPRLPFAFWLLGDTAHAAAVVHDWLYSAPVKVDRALADAVFREACECTGVGFFSRWALWAGVRVGGWVGYES